MAEGNEAVAIPAPSSFLVPQLLSSGTAGPDRFSQDGDSNPPVPESPPEENGDIWDQAKLIVAILNGSAHRYEELIRPFHQRIYRIALMHMKDEEDARDIAQESFLKAFLKLSTFQGRSQFSTWLTSITINEARNRLRQRSYQQQNFYSETSGMENTEYISRVPDHRETPSQLIERQELNQLLQRAIDNLKDDYRDVFVLRVVNELSTCETAARLKITNALVKTRLHRARAILQASLAPVYIGDR